MQNTHPLCFESVLLRKWQHHSFEQMPKITYVNAQQSWLLRVESKGGSNNGNFKFSPAIICRNISDQFFSLIPLKCFLNVHNVKLSFNEIGFMKSELLP